MLAIKDARRQAELRLQLEGLRASKVRIVELALGIYPPLLTERGLAAAAEMLAKRMPLPVSVDMPLQRWPSAVEVTAYLVLAEALVDVAKHAKASHARVEARAVDHRMVMEVVDDGVSGADPERGTGLAALQDRVVALGGTLTVTSPRGGGTCVEMELPCASALPAMTTLNSGQ
jgi:signal transduction histidine kinase